jgi:hypothetical protein
MKLKARLGCKNCNSLKETTIKLPFDCDNYTCLNCGKGNCLFVVSVLDEIKQDDPNPPGLYIPDKL